MRFDQIASFSVAGLSFLTAFLRSRGHPLSLRATSLTSYVYLLIPPVLGLVPFVYWYRRVRPIEK